MEAQFNSADSLIWVALSHFGEIAILSTTIENMRGGPEAMCDPGIRNLFRSFLNCTLFALTAFVLTHNALSQPARAQEALASIEPINSAAKAASASLPPDSVGLGNGLPGQADGSRAPIVPGDSETEYESNSTADGPSTGQGQASTQDECLDNSSTGKCVLRLEVDTSSATGSSSQTNNSTAPSILVKLDYLWHAPENRSSRFYHAEGKPLSDHLVGHMGLTTGYTQAVTTTKLQAAPGSTCSATCTSPVPQDAFVADSTFTVGFNPKVDGQTTLASLGLDARGAFDYLIPTNKVVQNGNLTYIQLTSANPYNAVGLYEATAHFQLSQIGKAQSIRNTASYPNVSNLLSVEGGYQNNRGLQHLAANPQMDTRNRYVGRLTVSPTLGTPTKQTRITMGIEYTGGIDGGPHVVQLFFGTTLNPPKLFGK
jgi:hypothetical protein